MDHRPTTIAPAVRFEPCVAFHDDEPGDFGVCTGCGWPLDDHEPDAAPKAA